MVTPSIRRNIVNNDLVSRFVEVSFVLINICAFVSENETRLCTSGQSGGWEKGGRAKLVTAFLCAKYSPLSYTFPVVYVGLSIRSLELIW